MQAASTLMETLERTGAVPRLITKIAVEPCKCSGRNITSKEIEMKMNSLTRNTLGLALGMMLSLASLVVVALIFGSSAVAQDTMDSSSAPFEDSKSAAKLGTAYLPITITYANVDGTFQVYVGVGLCGGSGWWGVNATTSGGAGIRASLMAAYFAGKKVQLHCTTSTGGYDLIYAMQTQ